MGPYQGKVRTDRKYRVKLADSVDLSTAVTGKVFGDITAVYGAEGATGETAYTVATADWQEQGHGVYWLRIGADEFTDELTYNVHLTCAGCAPVDLVIDVADKTLGEVSDDVDSMAATIATALGDVYWAEIEYRRDDDASKCRYQVRWHKNFARVTAGITTPTLTVKSTITPYATLINAGVLTDDGTGLLTYAASGAERQTLGTPYEVIATATIDGSPRTWGNIRGRDI